MCHDALTNDVLYCVVDQVVLCIRLVAELIWILSSSCLNEWLAQSWAVETRGTLRQLELKIRSNSEAGRTEKERIRTERNAPRRDGPKRIEPRRDELRHDVQKQYKLRREPNLDRTNRDRTNREWDEPNACRLTLLTEASWCLLTKDPHSEGQDPFVNSQGTALQGPRTYVNYNCPAPPRPRYPRKLQSNRAPKPTIRR